MIATGDLKASLRKLEACLRNLKYPGDVNYQGLALGDPSCFLPIVSHALISYSPYVAEHIMAFSVELNGASNLRFVESVYKVLRDLFNYKPQLTKEQFLQLRFADKKVRLVCDIINFAIQKHKELSKSSSLPPRRTCYRPFPPGSGGRDLSPSEIHEYTPAAPVVQQSCPLVERHVASATPALYSLSSDEQEPAEEDVGIEEQEQEHKKGQTEELMEPTAVVPAAVVARLQAMEAQLQCCERRLGQMVLLEDRLQSLERSMAGKIVLEQSQWENLESRVLLLETKLALSEAQKSPVTMDIDKIPSLDNLSAKITPEEDVRKGSNWKSPSPPQSLSTGTRSSSQSPPQQAQENMKDRLERIANMMKDTSSLLQSVEPSI
ncbi:centrosomal protein of 44 kDa [Engraulis encrasicolus]|uniref:centrosomal protein of 44 kDa n=1 Tax=Engraulis encrasicolus TaxID=184585 RepID=UPI002FD5788C